MGRVVGVVRAEMESSGRAVEGRGKGMGMGGRRRWVRWELYP